MAGRRGPPLLFYSFHIYTEAPSALASGGALALLLGAPGVAGAAVAALGAAALPWLHVKMVPAAAALGVVVLARLRGRRLAAFLAVAGAAAASCRPDYAVGAGVRGYAAGALRRPPRRRAGPDLACAAGTPSTVLWLAQLGVPARARGVADGLRSRGARPHVLVGLLASLGRLLSWRMWWGGQCPPARFLVPLLPLLAVALGLRLARSDEGPRPLVARAAARWGGALAAVAVANPGRAPAAQPGATG